jgi:GNAT superfamily N-acetyltransferase
LPKFKLTMSILFREALPSDAAELSELAFHSKAHWGYPAEFMQACRRELTVTPDSIAGDEIQTVVAVIQQELAGFYTLEDLADARIELGALFVKPKYIGQGIGRQLMIRAKTHAVKLGAHNMTIQGDPHALEFYRAAGASVIGELESGSIPGRFLPLLEIPLVTDDHTMQDRPGGKDEQCAASDTDQ